MLHCYELFKWVDHIFFNFIYRGLKLMTRFSLVLKQFCLEIKQLRSNLIIKLHDDEKMHFLKNFKQLTSCSQIAMQTDGKQIMNKIEKQCQSTLFLNI